MVCVKWTEAGSNRKTGRKTLEKTVKTLNLHSLLCHPVFIRYLSGENLPFAVFGLNVKDKIKNIFLNKSHWSDVLFEVRMFQALQPRSSGGVWG